MYEELKQEDIVRKVGGRFKLSTLIQKRLVQLNQGARPLITSAGDDNMAVVLQEIMHDKIFLDTAENVGFSQATEADPLQTIDFDEM